MFLHIFYTSFHTQINSGQMLHKRNCMCAQIRGNIATDPGQASLLV